MIVIVIAAIILFLALSQKPNVQTETLIKKSNEMRKLTAHKYNEIINLYKDRASKLSIAGIDAQLVLAIIAQESEGKPNARGTSGEYGLFQIMPFHFTKSELNNPFDLDVQFKVFTRIAIDNRNKLQAANCFTLTNFLAVYNAGYKGALTNGKGYDYAKNALYHYQCIKNLMK